MIKELTSQEAHAGRRMWTVSHIGGAYATRADAVKAWEEAGKPRTQGSSVWTTLHILPENDTAWQTAKTVTIAP